MQSSSSFRKTFGLSVIHPQSREGADGTSPAAMLVIAAGSCIGKRQASGLWFGFLFLMAVVVAMMVIAVRPLDVLALLFVDAAQIANGQRRLVAEDRSAPVASNYVVVVAR